MLYRSLVFSFGFALFFLQHLPAQEILSIGDFQQADAWYHGDAWETLSPGNWKIKNNALRWRLTNNGDGNPGTSFPWHWSSGGKTIEPRTGDRLPNLPLGMIWNRHWQLTGNYTILAHFSAIDLAPSGRGEKDGYFGICFGGESFYETRNFRSGKSSAASWMATVDRQGNVSLKDHRNISPVPGSNSNQSLSFKNGSTVEVAITVTGPLDGNATVTASFYSGDVTQSIEIRDVNRNKFTDGYLGLVGYGAVDFSVSTVTLTPDKNQ